MNEVLTKEESERIGLLSQLNIEHCPVDWLKSMLKQLRKLNEDKKRKEEREPVHSLYSGKLS